MRSSLSILAMLAVAACSGGGTSGGGTAGAGDGAANGDSGLTFSDIAGASAAAADTEATAFAAALDAFEADVLDVDGRPLDDYNFTAFVSVPTAGAATYTGFMNVNAGPTADLSAGLTLGVNFANDSITADQTTDFFADSNSTLVAYDGTLAFSNGKIGARGVDNSARLDIAGTLTGDGNIVVVDGEIFGKLVGTPIVGISANTTVAEAAARSNPDRAMNISLNGNAVSDGSAGFVVIDEKLR